MKEIKKYKLKLKINQINAMKSNAAVQCAKTLGLGLCGQ